MATYGWDPRQRRMLLAPGTAPGGLTAPDIYHQGQRRAALLGLAQDARIPDFGLLDPQARTMRQDITNEGLRSQLGGVTTQADIAGQGTRLALEPRRATMLGAGMEAETAKSAYATGGYGRRGLLEAQTMPSEAERIAAENFAGARTALPAAEAGVDLTRSRGTLNVGLAEQARGIGVGAARPPVPAPPPPISPIEGLVGQLPPGERAAVIKGALGVPPPPRPGQRGMEFMGTAAFPQLPAQLQQDVSYQTAADVTGQPQTTPMPWWGHIPGLAPLAGQRTYRAAGGQMQPATPAEIQAIRAANPQATIQEVEAILNQQGKTGLHNLQ